MQAVTTFFANRPPEGGQVAGQVAGPMGNMMRGGHPGGHFGGFFFGGLITAVWAALIVLLVLWIVRNWSNPNNPLTSFARRAVATVKSSSVLAPAAQTPLEIVQTRYAKGEINREEYEMIRRDLTGEAPAVSSDPVPSAPVSPVEAVPAQG